MKGPEAFRSPSFEDEGIEVEKTIGSTSGHLVELIQMLGARSTSLFESEVIERNHVPLEALEIYTKESDARDVMRDIVQPFFDTEDVTVRSLVAEKIAKTLLLRYERHKKFSTH